MVGRLFGNLIISNCMFSGIINGLLSVGGMIGWLSGSVIGIIMDCGSIGMVIIIGDEVGGMIGNVFGMVMIMMFYCLGVVDVNVFVGGFVGVF